MIDTENYFWLGMIIIEDGKLHIRYAIDGRIGITDKKNGKWLHPDNNSYWSRFQTVPIHPNKKIPSEYLPLNEGDLVRFKDMSIYPDGSECTAVSYTVEEYKTISRVGYLVTEKDAYKYSKPYIWD